MSPLDQYINALETRLDVETSAAAAPTASASAAAETEAYLRGLQAALNEAYAYQRANLPTGGTK